MTEHLPTPDKEQINLLETFDRLGLAQIELVSTPEQAAAALQALQGESALGFDTESKPTFAKNEASTGPHIVQLSTLHKAWIFQLEDAKCRSAVGELLESPYIIKAGFGLGDDKKRITYKLGVDLQGVLDLNAVFRKKVTAKTWACAARWQSCLTAALSSLKKPARPTGPTHS